MEAALLMARTTLHAAIEAKHSALEAKLGKLGKLGEKLTQIQMAGCLSCGGSVFTSSELQNFEANPSLGTLHHSWRNGYRCSECIAASEKRSGWFFVILGALALILLGWLSNP